jgi:hypothetical protein
MYLGTRKIRSAGRNSGSVEITLPSTIHILEGIECRIALRDGSRPEIILQPDLSIAQNLFLELWKNLQLSLKLIADIPDFNWSNFTFTFIPTTQLNGNPQLAYSDALIVQQKRGIISKSISEKIEGEDEALARIITCLAAKAGLHLQLSDNIAFAFGDAVAYLMTGVFSYSGADFERGMAHRVFWGNEERESLGSPFEENSWLKAQTPLRRVFEQFLSWQIKPSDRVLAREQWYRALSIEMKIF